MMTRIRKIVGFLFAVIVVFYVSVQIGLWLDRPIDLDAQPVSYPLGRDEIRIVPTGKCAGFYIHETEVELELGYSSRKERLVSHQRFWSHSSPLVIQIPDGLKDLQWYRLTGHFKLILTLKKGVVPNPNAPDKVEEILRISEPVKGYKIDSRWLAH